MRQQLIEAPQPAGTTAAAGTAAATGSGPPSLPAIPGAAERDRRLRVVDVLGRFGMQAIFFAVLLVLLVSSEDFRNPDNLLNVLQQSSITGILACGMLVIIISGGFDLSFGAIGVGASVSAAAVIVDQDSIVLGLTAALAVGLACGVLNGLLIAKVGISPFVATLGSATLITGIVLTQTGGKAIAGLPDNFTNVGLGRTLGVPNAALIFFAVALCTWLLLRTTRVGHYVYAVGSSKEPARLAGVPVDRVLLCAYVIGGVCAAIAGIVLLGQTNVGQPTGTEQWALSAIAAVVVGGTPLRGGIGGVYSVILGTLLLGVVSNALNLYGVSPYWQPAVTGTVILLAVGVDSYQRKVRGGIS
jgi:ribose/xylose/arabinose/galactoside ABC-type transport system permease subunit